MIGNMELILVAALVFVLRRPAIFLLRIGAWAAVVSAMVLMLLGVAFGVAVPPGFLAATLTLLVALHLVSRRRGNLRNPVVV